MAVSYGFKFALRLTCRFCIYHKTQGFVFITNPHQIIYSNIFQFNDPYQARRSVRRYFSSGFGQEKIIKHIPGSQTTCFPTHAPESERTEINWMVYPPVDSHRTLPEDVFLSKFKYCVGQKFVDTSHKRTKVCWMLLGSDLKFLHGSAHISHRKAALVCFLRESKQVCGAT